jgi:hypothetical protein
MRSAPRFSGQQAQALAPTRRFSVNQPPAAQVLRLAATLPSGGQERLERLRGFGSGLGRALTCTCSRIVAGDGRGAVLIVAAERAGPTLTLAERLRGLLDEDPDPAAGFMPDGRLVYAAAKPGAGLPSHGRSPRRPSAATWRRSTG